MSTTITVSGDSIVNRQISICNRSGFQEVRDLFRTADVGFTHLEMLLHDYDDPEVYPAAEAGGTWMRGPPAVADELDWMGVDMVSHASNHALDYAYGGIRSTWEALDTAGVKHAGTGKNLADARAPTYFETDSARVGLVSMATSFTRWSKAGPARTDVRGRPGLNPLGYHYEVNHDLLETICELARQFGWWITRTDDDEIILNRGGVHNTTYRYVPSDQPGVRATVDERDRRNNLRAVEDATHQADLTLVHVHSHEFAPDEDITIPPQFLEEFGRNCVDAGADVVVIQGSHAPIRPLEIYDGAAIFYDPGDCFFMSDTTTKLPAEFYYRHGDDLETHPFEATPSEGFLARGVVRPWGSSPVEEDEDGSTFGGDENLLNPADGMFTGPGSLVPACEFDSDQNLTSITLYPIVWYEQPKSVEGFPRLADGNTAERILDHISELSEPYGTSITIEDGRGIVALEQ